MTITKAQRVAVKRCYDRYGYDCHNVGCPVVPYRDFRRGVKHAIGIDCLMLQQYHDHGIWLGIETDGHTHS